MALTESDSAGGEYQNPLLVLLGWGPVGGRVLRRGTRQRFVDSGHALKGRRGVFQDVAIAVTAIEDSNRSLGEDLKIWSDKIRVQALVPILV